MTIPASPDQPHPMRQVLILSLAPCIGVGFGRFAYALVLPDMRESLAWSYAGSGFMNTANSAGYFSGALVAAYFARRFGLFRSVLIGVAMCVVSLIICAATGHFIAFSFARFLSGVGAAVSFVSGASLAAAIAQSHPARSDVYVGAYNSGPGIGLVVSGLTAPFLLQGFGPGSWWIVWTALAVISVAMAAVLLGAPRNNAAPPPAHVARVPVRPMGWFLAAYGLFGAGYIAYMTFMFAYVRDAGGSAAFQSIFWCLIGAGALASTFLWRRLMARGRDGSALAALLTVLVIATLCARFGQSPLWLALSAFMFGSASFGIGAAILTFARFNYPPGAWPRVIGVLTMAFSIGQTVGPSITGAIADAMGSLSSALNASMAALAIAIVLALLQKPVARAAAPEQ